MGEHSNIIGLPFFSGFMALVRARPSLRSQGSRAPGSIVVGSNGQPGRNFIPPQSPRAVSCAVLGGLYTYDMKGP